MIESNNLTLPHVICDCRFRRNGVPSITSVVLLNEIHVAKLTNFVVYDHLHEECCYLLEHAVGGTKGGNEFHRATGERTYRFVERGFRPSELSEILCPRHIGWLGICRRPNGGACGAEQFLVTLGK